MIGNIYLVVGGVALVAVAIFSAIAISAHRRAVAQISDTPLMKIKRSLGKQDAEVFQWLIDGIAFKQPGNYYTCTSHEGDHLGNVPSVIVETLISRLKNRGLRPGYIADRNGKNSETNFTLAWDGPSHSGSL